MTFSIDSHTLLQAPPFSKLRIRNNQTQETKSISPKELIHLPELLKELAPDDLSFLLQVAVEDEIKKDKWLILNIRQYQKAVSDGVIDLADAE